MIDELAAKKIRLSSEQVEQYSELRVKRYGQDGALPAEFFPAYQWLRPGDWTREFLVFGGDVVLTFKKVRIFSAQYNRLEGLPLSLSGDLEKERQALDIILGCGWLHKARLCSGEASHLLKICPLEIVQESAVSNFWYDPKERYDKTLKSSWRPKAVLNWAKQNGILAWRPFRNTDISGISALYSSWVEKKSQENQDVMYKELYSSLVAKTLHETSKLDISVMTWDSKVIAFVVHLISGGAAHLLANISVANTVQDFGCPEKIRPYVGSLIPHFSSKAFMDNGIHTVFLGYCEENDPLIKYKRSLANGETKLYVVDICKPPEKKKQEPQGGLF